MCMDELRETLANNLLELDKKNKLINFRDYKLKSIEVVRPSLEEVFNMISNGCKISFVNLDFINKNDKKDMESSKIQLFEELELKKNQIVAYKKDIDSQIVLKKYWIQKKRLKKKKD